MERECTGDASESAILRFMESVSPIVDEYRNNYPKVAEKPFSSVYKYQYSVHQDMNATTSVEHFIAMKGAPERILQMCTTTIDGKIVNKTIILIKLKFNQFLEFGNTVPLVEEDHKSFEDAYKELGSMGERVLAFCDKQLSGFEQNYKFNLKNDLEINEMRFLGLIALIDPPR